MARRSPESTVSPVRGVAIVVVAVLVGLFLLRNGLDTSQAFTSDDEASTDDGGSDTTGGDTGTTDDTATDEGGTEDTTPELRPPDQVPTIVLNGSGVSGAAGRYSEFLAGLGYQLTNPTGGNVDPGKNVPATQILFTEGFEPEALALATAIGAPTIVPAPLTDPPPGTIVGANLVLVLGPDLANTTPTTASPDASAGTDTAETTG